MKVYFILCCLICGQSFAEQLVPIPFDPEMDIVVEEWRGLYLDPIIRAECTSFDPSSPIIKPSDDSPYIYKWYNLELYGIEKVHALNRSGGRSYIYDLRWNSACYVFNSKDEKDIVGNHVIRWLRGDLSEAQIQHLLLSLGWRGLYTNTKYDKRAFVDVLKTVGCFLDNKQTRMELWKLILDKDTPLHGGSRIICLRSIISQFDTFSEDVKSEVVGNTIKFIETNNDLVNYPYFDRIQAWVQAFETTSTN